MATKEEFAQLSLYVYNVTGSDDNRPLLPSTDWIRLDYYPDDGVGFSYGVFQNQATGEVVVSFTGTNEKKAADFLLANLPAGIGIYSPQVEAATLASARIIDKYGAADVSFTGHSLGGGLASVMAVWFARPATVFDTAPFELTARNPNAVIAAQNILVRAGISNASLNSFEVLGNFSQREAAVTGYYTSEEALQLLRMFVPTITGSENRVEFGVDDMLTRRVDLHSQALLTAGLMSESFRLSTVAVQRSIPLMMDPNLYAFDPASSNQRNFLIDLIRSEQGTGDKLTHFAADLQKLGTNIAGLNAAAQNAIIAQGIEWYYWQSNNYAGKEFLAQTGSLLQYTTARGDGLEGAQNKAGIYTAGWLASLQNDHGAAYAPIVRVDYEQWSISAGNSGVTATAKDAAKSQVFVGGGGVDNFTGGDKADTLLGGIGNDQLNGGAGSDVLFGGAGTDTYSFKDAFGKDTLTDSDGQGTIQIDGQTIGTAQGAGKRNVWVAEVSPGQYVGMSVYDDQSSSTGKKLVITRAGSTDNAITINNFDLAKAEGEGYLGIKLDPTQRVALVQGTGSDVGASTSNVWADNTFKASSLEGQSSNVVEANGKSFNIYLAQAAHVGDTLTLSLDGALASEFKARIDGVIVDADGAVITLAEGQTSVSFSLLEDGEITADMAGSISASYLSPNETADSNVWALSLQDTGETGRTYTGDQRAMLIGIEIDTNITPDQSSFNTYKWGATSWAADGTLNGGIAQAGFADVIYASSGNDKIDGKGGNDALSGGAGNDQIDGGEGNDMIAGGTGSDDIQGGAGDDYISSSSPLATPQRKKPSDSWSPPAGQEVKVSSATWGVYLKDQGGSIVTVWDGVGDTDTGGTEGDAVDGGAGNDDIIASWGDDRVQGGEGDDRIDGLAGDDVLEGGDGDDRISADGITKEGFLNSVDAASNGVDFVDGGAGNDNINGGGKDDQLFGGAGDDFLVGDSAGKTDGEYYVELQYHGQDYLDGEDGDDYLEGGGKDDSLYGGMGADRLWGDTSADNIVNESDNVLMWGNDYLDGEDGGDQLVGGGKDDTLYGGAGDDKLWGDEQNINLGAEFHGQDYLDGEDGDDYLEGGGKSDILFGGKGKDTLWGDTGADNIVDESDNVLMWGYDYLDGEDGDDQLVGGGNDDTLYGGIGDDKLFGDEKNIALKIAYHGLDYLDGEDGDDYLEGGGKDDTLFGGKGKDNLWGDAATDVLGGADHGNDYLDGEEDNDSLVGNGGADTLYGGSGDDDLFGDTSAASLAGEFHGGDYLDGEEGDDYLQGGGAADMLIGGAGQDILLGDERSDVLSGLYHGADQLNGGEGDDYLEGGGAADTLIGGVGHDTLIGDEIGAFLSGQYHGADQLDGGDGDDYLEGGGAADTLIGGAGYDTLIGDEIGAFLSGQYHGADLLDGGDGDDYLEGGGAADTLIGGAGNDYLVGDQQGTILAAQDHGNDTLDGGDGDDTLFGGGGDDTLLGGAGNDFLSGDDSLSSLVAGQLTGNDTMVGGDGNDVALGGKGNDTIAGDAGDDILLGGEGTDTIDGGDGNDTLEGAEDADTLDGGTGDDTLYGDAGDDLLRGGDGNDVLDSGDGNDTLDGGMGNDVFGVLRSDGTKRIIDDGGFDRLILTWKSSDTYLDLGSLKLTNKATGQEVHIEGFDVNDPLGSLSIEEFVLLDDDGNQILLTAEQLLARGRELVGTPQADFIVGTGMHERISALESDDTVWAGGGDDTVNGGDGNDALLGEAGNDVLNGGTGDDLLLGADGDDTLKGDIGNDALYGGEGHDLLDGDAGNDLMVGGGGDDTVNGGEGNDQLMGEAGNDVLNGATGDDLLLGAEGDDTLLGETGNDVLHGEAGRDLLDGGAGSDVMVGGAGDDTVNGGDGDDQLMGEADNDVLNGGAGDDLMEGGTGADALTGGAGNDTYVFDQTGDFAVELVGEGRDTVQSQISLSLGNNIEDLVLTGLANLNGTGNALDNVLTGNTGNNVLDGAVGADVMRGGAGDDSYYVESSLDTVIEGLDEGRDEVLSSISYTLTDSVEKLALLGAAGLTGTGNLLNNELLGNDGANVLDGGAGIDIMTGGFGNDTYWVDNTADEVIESQAGRIGTDWRWEWNWWSGYQLVQFVTTIVDVDTVNASASFTLGANVENLNLIGATSINGTGNVLENQIVGNEAANTLDGGSGNDVLIGAGGDDRLLGADGDDTLQGETGNDALYGGVGRDILDGGAGSDVMAGGSGDDHYLVDNVDDQVIETEEGQTFSSSWGSYFVLDTDTVDASVSFTLSNNVERLNLVGTADIDGTGSDQDNWITGNSGVNVLTGGRGNDVYWVQNTDDKVVEYADEGLDLVISNVDFTLAAHVERLELDYGSAYELGTAVYGAGGATDNNIRGNAQNNVLRGEGGNDELDGEDGNDAIYGGIGNDVLRGGNDTDWGADFRDNRDTLDGGEGNDSIDGESGDDLILGGTGDDTLYGGNDNGNEENHVLTNNDLIYGGDGNDSIDGGTGADQLFGNEGDDIIYGGISSIEQEYFDPVTGLTWLGTASDSDLLDGGDGNDYLDGGAGDDVLLGGDGVDRIFGGDENDVIYSSRFAGGLATLPWLSSISYSDDAASVDYVEGGWGDDVYFVDGVYEKVNYFVMNDCGDEISLERLQWSADSVTEHWYQGYDVVLSSGSFALTDNIEELHLVFDPDTAATDPQYYADMLAFGQDGTGNDLDNIIVGNELANRLDGGWGTDKLEGGLGNDTYVVDQAGDIIVEHGDGGIDTVESYISYALEDANLENLTLLNGAYAGEGNGLANTLIGNMDDNRLSGQAGNDKLIGGMGNDQLAGGEGDDRYVFRRGDGWDVIDDWQGNDTLYFGNDLSAADIELWRDFDDLILFVGVSNDVVQLVNWFIQAEGVKRLEFCDAESVLLETLINHAPITLEDADEVVEDLKVVATGNVLTNDSDPDADNVLEVTYPDVYAGKYGVLTLNWDGAYTYELDNSLAEVQSLADGEALTESFEYSVRDYNTSTDSFEVASVLTLRIIGSNDAPVVMADAGEVSEDDIVSVGGNVLSNDSDIDTSDTLSVVNAGSYYGQYGQLVLGADGAYSYRLDNASDAVQSLSEGELVTDVFSVVSNDGHVNGYSDLTIGIRGANDGPLAVDDAVSVIEDTQPSVAGSVLANDTDIDAGAVLAVTNPGSYAGLYGSLDLLANGSYSYRLDNSGSVQALAMGAVVTESFAYSISDGLAASTAHLNITITGTNDGPLAQADAAQVSEDRMLQATGNVLSNDSDPDTGDTLKVANPATYQGQYGSLVLAADGSYTYSLNNSSTAVQSLGHGVEVTDTFRYTVTDMHATGAMTAQSNLVITITGANDAPVLVADIDTVTEDLKLTASGNVLGNDTDLDTGTALQVTNAGSYTGQYGNLTLNANGSYVYALNNALPAVQALAQGQIISESFSYNVTDANASNPLGATSTLTLRIVGTNDGPVATADAGLVAEDTLLQTTGNVLTNDSDIDTGNQLAVSNAGLRVGQYGQLALAANGDYVYTLKNSDVKVQSLAAGQMVTETFSYTVQDNSTVPGVANSSIVITVTGTNDAPTLDAPLSNRALTTGQTLSFALPATTFSDIDQGDVLSYGAQMVNAQGGVQALPTWLQFNAVTRTFSGTPTVAGTYSIRVTATDLSGATALDEFNIAVSATSTGGKGNEGLGNGQDAPPPGHNYNWNDGPGTSPGNPGRRGGGKPSAILTLANTAAGSREQLLESFWNGADSVISSVNYVLPAHKKAVILSGTASLNATGNELDNWLVGNAGSNILQGGSGGGTDILQGGGGNDQLTDMIGSNLLDGGDGSDVVTDGNGGSYLLGGKGNDTLNLGLGADLIGFNRGDGVDIVNSGQETTANDVLSLGGGIRFTDLKLTRNGNNLKLDLGLGDSITFNKWYVGTAYRSVAKLQVLTTGGDYDAHSSDITRNQKVEVFDFAKLAKDFDTARAAQAGNANGWAVMNSLLSAHLGASDTLALGGDLAYQYGTTGGLGGLGLAATQGILEAGAGWQNLNRNQESQTAVRLG